MPSVQFCHIITHFLMHIAWQCTSRLIQLAKNIVMITVANSPRLQLCHHWQIFVQARLHLVVQTCDNPMEAGPDYTGGVGEVQTSAFS